MDWVYAHLLVNHFPIVLGIVGAVFALIGLVTRRLSYWMFAMTALVIAGLTAYPAVFTGTRAEHAVERSWWLVRGSVHSHEEAGELTMWILIATGIVSAYGLHSATRPAAPGRSSFPGWVRALVVIGALASAGAASWTAYLGGKILHRAPALTAPAPPAGMPTSTPP